MWATPVLTRPSLASSLGVRVVRLLDQVGQVSGTVNPDGLRGKNKAQQAKARKVNPAKAGAAAARRGR